MKGHLHVHTMYSLNDSTLSVEALLQKAHQLGMTAIALTDHGTLLGVDDFLQALNDKITDINRIVGVEVFVSFNENVQELSKTSTCLNHLVLLAKDLEGYKQISNIVTASNHPDKLLRINKKRIYPVVTPSILQTYVKGGHIVALSACIQGVVSNRLLQNYRTAEKINQLVTEKDFAALSENVQKGRTALETLKKQYTATTDDFEKSKLQNRIEIAEMTQKNMEKEYEKKEKENADRLTLQQTLKSDADLFKEACSIAGWFKNLFGQEDFYIELQNHGLPEEKFIAAPLIKIASIHQLKVVATNDVHILNHSEDDALARTISKFNGYGTWFEPEPSDMELDLKTEKELENMLLQIYPLQIVQMAMNSIDEIANKCHVELKQEYHYPVFTP